jgi:cob(I)alamin adenosyltransferase
MDKRLKKLERELDELEVKIDKLEAFLDDEDRVEELPQIQLDIMCIQLNSMVQYALCLNTRIDWMLKEMESCKEFRFEGSC